MNAYNKSAILTISAATLAIVSFCANGFGQQESPPLETPAQMLERVSTLEETGNYKLALDILMKVEKVADVEAAKKAKNWRATIEKKLGKANVSRSAQELDVNSPVERRILGQINGLANGTIVNIQFRDTITALGPPAVAAIDRIITNRLASDHVIDELLMCLQKIGDNGAFFAMEKLLSSEDPVVASRARVLMSPPHGSGADEDTRFEGSQRMLKHSDPAVRVLAIQLLAQSAQTRNNAEKRKSIIQSVYQDSSPKVRVELINNFGMYLDSSVVEHFAKDEVDEVRRAIAKAILSMTIPEREKVIISLLRDKNTEVRNAAIIAILNLPKIQDKDFELSRAVSLLVVDPSDAIRSRIPEAARRIGGPNTIPILLSLRYDTVKNVIDRVAEQLINYSNSQARREDLLPIAEALRESTKGTHIGFRENAMANSLASLLVYHLRKIGVADDVSLLCPILAESPGVLDRSEVPFEILKLATFKDSNRVAELMLTSQSANTSNLMLQWLEQVGSKNHEIFNLEFVNKFLQQTLKNSAKEFERTRWLTASLMLRFGLRSFETELREALPAVNDTSLVTNFAASARAADKKHRDFIVSILSDRLLKSSLPSESDPNNFVVSHSVFDMLWNAIFELANKDDAELIGKLLLDKEIRRKASAVLSARNSEYVRYALSPIVKADANIGIPILKQIWSEVPEYRYEVIASIPSAWGDAGSEFLLSNGFGEGPPDLRESTIQILGRNAIFTNVAIDKVTECWTDANPNVRRAVIDYLSDWNQPAGVTTVRKLLNDKSAEVRKVAAVAIGRLLSADAAAELVPLLGDANDRVREAASNALKQIREYHEQKQTWENWYKNRGTSAADGLRKLFDMMEDNDPVVRIAAFESLGTLKAKDALPVLVEKLKNTAAGAERDAIAKAISKINQ
ncbi:MAG: HEAT repeat domain-containing protein [Planctomycetota bacterium]